MININELSPDVADAYREYVMDYEDATVDDFIHDECAVCIHTGKYIVTETAHRVGDDYVSDEHKIHYLDEYELAEIAADDWRGSND